MIGERTATNFVFCLALLAASAAAPGCALFGEGRPSKARQAEQAALKGRHEEAAQLYEQHMRARLAVPGRPADENPYFYCILIGDQYLALGRAEQARQWYGQAVRENVDRELLSDRLRSFARWNAAHGKFEDAFALLREFREVDPLMFDYELDRIHKQMVQQDEQGLDNSREIDSR